MRVAIVGDYPQDSTRIQGGVQAAFAYLVQGLSHIDGLQIHVLTFGKAGQREPLQIEQNKINLHLLPPFPRFELAKNFRTYQATLDKTLAAIQPDVVHAQDTTDHAYVALRSRYPAVVTVHGIRVEDGKHSSSFRLRMRNYLYDMLIGRSIIRRMRHLIAISSYVTSYFSARLQADTQVYYIPNAIAEDYFNLPAPTSPIPVVLFAGRVIPRKRVFELVQAFAPVAQQTPQAQLRIAGECSSEPAYVESIRNFIRQAGLDRQVHLLGSLDEAAVLHEFSGCTVLALPSAQETTPMVIAQAMAAGKPVIATPVGGVAEMVNHGETGFFVEVGDIDGLAQALLCLLQDPSLRLRMGQAGYKFAVENYRADSVARRTYEVYQKIVATGR
jgi:glycosyltransferase involved in cell wall biosynthesis